MVAVIQCDSLLSFIQRDEHRWYFSSTAYRRVWTRSGYFVPKRQPCCLKFTETPKNTGKYFTVILISKLMTVVKKIQKKYWYYIRINGHVCLYCTPFRKTLVNVRSMTAESCKREDGTKYFFTNILKYFPAWWKLLYSYFYISYIFTLAVLKMTFLNSIHFRII